MHEIPFQPRPAHLQGDIYLPQPPTRDPDKINISISLREANALDLRELHHRELSVWTPPNVQQVSKIPTEFKDALKNLDHNTHYKVRVDVSANLERYPQLRATLDTFQEKVLPSYEQQPPVVKPTDIASYLNQILQQTWAHFGSEWIGAERIHIKHDVYPITERRLQEIEGKLGKLEGVYAAVGPVEENGFDFLPRTLKTDPNTIWQLADGYAVEPPFELKLRGLANRQKLRLQDTEIASLVLVQTDPRLKGSSIRLPIAKANLTLTITELVDAYSQWKEITEVKPFHESSSTQAIRGLGIHPHSLYNVSLADLSVDANAKSNRQPAQQGESQIRAFFTDSAKSYTPGYQIPKMLEDLEKMLQAQVIQLQEIALQHNPRYWPTQLIPDRSTMTISFPLEGRPGETHSERKWMEVWLVLKEIPNPLKKEGSINLNSDMHPKDLDLIVPKVLEKNLHLRTDALYQIRYLFLETGRKGSQSPGFFPARKVEQELLNRYKDQLIKPGQVATLLKVITEQLSHSQQGIKDPLFLHQIEVQNKHFAPVPALQERNRLRQVEELKALKEKNSDQVGQQISVTSKPINTMTTSTSESGLSDMPIPTVPLHSLKSARYSVDELVPMLKGKLFEVEGKVSPETAVQVEKLLKGQKTDLMVFPDGTVGKLFVIQEKDKHPIIHQQDVRQNLYIPNEYMGHKFSQADLENLRQYGNMGRSVELTDQFTKKTIKAFIGVDKDINTLKVVKAEKFNVPTKLLGVELSAAQQEKLREGKSVRIDNMQKQDKAPFSAYVRYHAGEEKLTYDRTPTPAQRRAFAIQQQQNPAQTTSEKQANRDPVTKTSRNASAAQEAASALNQKETTTQRTPTALNESATAKNVAVKKEKATSKLKTTPQIRP